MNLILVDRTGTVLHERPLAKCLTVIGGDQDQGILVKIKLFPMPEQLSDCGVNVCHTTVVLRDEMAMLGLGDTPFTTIDGIGQILVFRGRAEARVPSRESIAKGLRWKIR